MPRQSARLYLVDGSSYIYRAFFALPPLTGPGGQPSNAVYGFTTMLMKLLEDTRPQYLGIVLDAPGRTFRDDIYPEYKANRPPTPADLSAQFPLVREIVDGFGLCCPVVSGVEADDVIATLVDRIAAEETECVVVTGDKDLMQLVGPRVRLWDTMRDRWTDVADVESRLGVSPEHVVDVMALMGDSVDNIPGVKGIGEKTAVALVRHFGSLESVLDNLDQVPEIGLRGGKKVAERLREGAEAARMSRDLALVRRDVAVDLELEDFRVTAPDPSALRRLFLRMGFQSLLRQVAETTVPSAVRAAAVRDPVELSGLQEKARKCGWLALAAVAPEGPPSTTDADEVVLCTQGAEPLRVSLSDERLRDAFLRLASLPDVRVVAHDWKRDLHGLLPHGLSNPNPGFDVMIASYLVDATSSHKLEDLAHEMLGKQLPPFRTDLDSTSAGVAILGELSQELRRRLRKLALEELFDRVEMPLVRILAAIERKGILLDVELLQSMSVEFAERLDVLMKKIHELAGGEFNINSPPQLRTVLFERLGMSTRGVRRGKTGLSTDIDVLTRLAADHPLPAKILEYRALAKLKSTYVDALPAAVNPATRRLHTSLHQAVAATGRLSSSDPNLQNIPIRGEEGRRIRQAFVAPADHVLLAADYSQIELRVLAHLSHDEALSEAFTKGEDVHLRTAVEVFGVLPGTVTADMRRAAKVINFGIIYGMGPVRLAQELDITVAEASRYIASYFERYAGVRSYMQEVVAEARERGYVTTILGRRRAVPDLRSKNRHLIQAAERVAANTPIQGSAADLIKLAMVAVDRRIEQAKLPATLILQVHDELLFEVRAEGQEEVAAAVCAEMEGVMPLAVPLRVDVGFGKSWAEAH